MDSRNYGSITLSYGGNNKIIRLLRWVSGDTTPDFEHQLPKACVKTIKAVQRNLLYDVPVKNYRE